MSDFWNSVDEDLEFEHEYMPAVRHILAVKYKTVEPATEFLDLKRATDLIVDGHHMAVRVRRAVGTKGQQYLRDYASDFTIRNTRTSGAETELSKILQGFGTRMFYGFGHKHQIVSWIEISLVALRWALVRNELEKIASIKSNKDRRTTLAAFHLESLAKHGCRVLLDSGKRFGTSYNRFMLEDGEPLEPSLPVRIRSRAGADSCKYCGWFDSPYHLKRVTFVGAPEDGVPVHERCLSRFFEDLDNTPFGRGF